MRLIDADELMEHVCRDKLDSRVLIAQMVNNAPTVDIVSFLREIKDQITKSLIKWITVSEKMAKFPCLACDNFSQIFIPCGVVTIDNRCYDGIDFMGDVKKFLRGKEGTIGGKKAYILPREIIAWMPMPKPYEVEGAKE